MGSSETGAVVECGVGSIVWVRRRNGSWWPGKILGLEEISSSFLTSPRSGTPVKLLGRADASVDWYNLEKSKRVKAFRCGEFDECIERAEAAQGMPPKKREKYARREDAIMHALKLERQLLEKKCGKLGNSSNGSNARSPDAVTSSIYLGNESRNQNDSRLDQLSQNVGSSVSEKNVPYQNMYEETLREGNQLSGDDDSAGMLPRMRGLQDFGLLTAPPRKELSGVAFRSKRSRNAYMPYDSVDYLIDDQTLSSQLEIPVSKIEENSYPRAGLFENHISGSTEDTETDSSETNSLESDSDDEMTALSDASASIELHPKYLRRIETPEEHASISGSDDVDELTVADRSSHPPPHGHLSTNIAVSKWQHKGRTNDGNLLNDNRKSSKCNHSVPDHSDRSLKSRALRYGPTSPQGSYEIADIDRRFGWNSRSSIKRYRDDWHDDDILALHLFGGVGATLMDVDLKVHANNYRKDTPLISLTSKLNGHAIVGHPIKIEALQSGYLTETYVSVTDYFAPNPAPLTSKWRTGRRTANSRVRRPFFTSMPHSKGKETELRDSARDISNRKIRAISSFAPGNHQSDSRGGGLTENGTKCTPIACIPISLAFSRLHEDLVIRHQQ